MNDFQQLKLQGHGADYGHEGSYRRHTPLSRQPSFQHQGIFGLKDLQGQPVGEYVDHPGRHANVTRIHSYPVEGPVPLIRQARPNMIRQSSTSDPLIYQDEDRMLRAQRTYYPEPEFTHWSAEEKLYTGQPHNLSDPTVWLGPQSQHSPEAVTITPRSTQKESTEKGVLTSGPPFPPGDARLFVFYNLSAIFNENDILDAMRRHPEERDPQKICGYIINKN